MIDLITITNPTSVVSEAYRTLRTNLSFYSLDDPLRTLVCASAEPNEDKSITAANLAVTIAQGGSRTILVDADLRRPALHTIFGLDNSLGLTDAIINKKADIPLQSTPIENLFVLTSGTKPPNPADILGSKKVDALIERLKETADFIIFDAPPVIAVTDTVVLGSKTDGVLMIIEAGVSRRDHAERARDILEKAHVRIVGATLTNAPREDTLDGYYN